VGGGGRGGGRGWVRGGWGVFGAVGMLTTDLVFQEGRSMLQRPPLDAGGVAAVNALYGELEAGVLAAFAREGFAAARVQLERSVDMRFTMQVHELDVEMPGRTIESKDIDAVIGAFVEKYEQTYGKNSAYTAAGGEMVTFRAVGTMRLERPPLPSTGEDSGGTRPRLGSRPAYFC